MATSALSIRLFGATSAVGRQLLPRLAQATAEVTASSRVPQAGGAALHWLRDALPGAAAVDPATTHILSLGPLDLFVDWLAQQAPAGRLRQVIAFGSTSATTKSDSPAAAERALVRVQVRLWRESDPWKAWRQLVVRKLVRYGELLTAGDFAGIEEMAEAMR